MSKEDMSMSFVNPIKMAEDDDNEAGEKKGANKKLDATKKVAIGGNTDNLFLNLADKTMQDDLNRSLITKVLQFHLDPDGQFRRTWDVCILVLVVYSSTWEPYKAAFLTRKMSWWEWALDSCYWMDVFISFWTAYTDSGYKLVTDKRLIAKKYLKFWFWIDILATFPWDFLVLAIFESVNPDTIRLVRMMRVFRLARASRIIHRLTSNWVIHTTYIEAVKFFLYAVVVAHLLACLFWIWPGLFYEADDYTWRAAENLEDQPHNTQYTQSLYWAITTMTTIGYGDITPVREAEVIFTIFAMLIGVSFFALLVTQINELNVVIGGEVQHYEHVKNDLVSYMKDHSVETKLIRRVVEYLNFRSSSHAAHSFNEQDHRLDVLSGPLRKELRVTLFLPIVKKLKMFGWNRTEVSDREVRSLFDEIDDDGDGTLDRGELQQLVLGLGEKVSENELKKLMAEMEFDESGEVTFEAFRTWWKRKEAKVARFPKAPDDFMRTIACLIHTVATAPGDIISEKGEYGRRLYVVCEGVVHVSEDAGEEGPKLIRIIEDSQAEPVFGTSAMLDNADCLMIHVNSAQRFGKWVVSSEGYCNLAFVSRRDLREAVDTMWPDGADSLRKQALEAYIDDADATAEKYSGPTEYNLKTMLLSRYGLRADDDEPTRREVYENLLGRLEKLEGAMDQRLSNIEALLGKA